MKKFILKIFLITLPIFISLFCMEIILRKIPNDYKQKASYLKQNSNQIETLILGSSHSFYGINPEYLSGNAFNASHVSQSLDYDYEILMNYSDRFDRLQTIYIPISYFSFWSRLDTGAEKWRTNLYYDSYGIKKNMTTTDYFKINESFKPNFFKVAKFIIKDKNDITSTKLGWGTKYKSKNAKDLTETGKKAAERHTEEIHSKKLKIIFKENVVILKKIISWGNSRGINIIMFTPPAFNAYTDNLDKEQLIATINTATTIAETYDNCYYINMMNDSCFIAKDFYDSDHLSEIGAEKLSIKLNIINKARTHNIGYRK